MYTNEKLLCLRHPSKPTITFSTFHAHFIDFC
jgi:hypothetical protein